MNISQKESVKHSFTNLISRLQELLDRKIEIEEGWEEISKNINTVHKIYCDAITELISKKNVEIVYCGRVLVRIPPSKVNTIMEKFPEIEERQTYAWCTHVWPYEDMSNLEYALR